MSRLNDLTDTVTDMIAKMADGNPGAMAVLFDILRKAPGIDPKAGPLAAIGPILDLDSLGIYGPRIWQLAKDGCKGNILHVIAVLRAWQLGFIKADNVRALADGHSDLDLEEITETVKKRLGGFETPAEQESE
ncbi:hypothetical protein FJY70_00235 [candidate division WOR-3 bacterium]|nr:hypothetical protein [candidate division WOR-3 bacterium]